MYDIGQHYTMMLFLNWISSFAFNGYAWLKIYAIL